MDRFWIRLSALVLIGGLFSRTAAAQTVESHTECGLRYVEVHIYSQSGYREEQQPMCQLLRVTVTTPLINLFGPFTDIDVRMEQRYTPDPTENCPCEKYCKAWGYEICPPSTTPGDENVTPGGDEEEIDEEFIEWVLEHLIEIQEYFLSGGPRPVYPAAVAVSTPAPTPTPNPTAAPSPVKVVSTSTFSAYAPSSGSGSSGSSSSAVRR